MKLLQSEETGDFPEKSEENKPPSSSLVEGNDRGVVNGDAVLDVSRKMVILWRVCIFTGTCTI